MKKIKLLQQRIYRIAGITLVSASVLGGAYYFTDNFANEKAEKLRVLDNEMRQQNARLAQLENKFNIYESSFFAYKDIHASLLEGKYQLDINRARRVLELLRKRHRITNLNVEITSQETIKQQTSEEYVGFKPVFRQVNLRFSAMTDLHVYAFAQNIQKLFSGHIQMVRVHITRRRPFSEEILAEVAKGATPVVVEAEIMFLWKGIEEINEEEPANAATTP